VSVHTHCPAARLGREEPYPAARSVLCGLRTVPSHTTLRTAQRYRLGVGKSPTQGRYLWTFRFGAGGRIVVQMALDDWDWRLPRDNQDLAWDCAACSTAWAMRTVGFEVSEHDVIAGLGPSRISPTYGLLDASGAGLVSYLAEQGISAENNSAASFEQVMAAAGHQPMVIGGRSWCHWVAVRIGSALVPGAPEDTLLLMNPAPGYMGIDQVLDRYGFETLGSFSAVWFTAW